MKTRYLSVISFTLAILAGAFSSHLNAASKINNAPGAHLSTKCRVLLVRTFEVVLEPGVWHGFSLGPSSNECAYVAKVTPLEPAKDGSYIEKTVVQPESDGNRWNDVLRVMIPGTQEKLKVKIRVYKICE